VLTENLAREQDRRKCIYWPDPTPVDPAQRNADITTRFGTGAISPNQIRTEFGDKPYEFGGDDPVLPMGVAPVPWASNQQMENESVDFSEPLDETDNIDQPDSTEPAAAPGETVNRVFSTNGTHATR
jgi:hypothetical protein